MTATLELARKLIARPSITPADAGCQPLIAERLAGLGFRIEWLPFGDVMNLWAELGDTGPRFVFGGHTDVVPPGPLAQWSSDPFEPREHDGLLFGRGAADMKSSLAAMVTATERFLARRKPSNRLAFLITSDEEGPAVNGTRRVMETLKSRGVDLDWCLLGEPSSNQTLGDTIKIGRRGSLNARLRLIGVAGHVAYPHLACNPIHHGLPALAALSAMEWDRGDALFPATNFQISNVHAGVGAGNVIPGSMEVDFNLRYSPQLDAQTIKQRVAEVLQAHALDYELEWHLSGEPFLTTATTLIEAVEASVKAVTGATPRRSTSGGTSDGRFIAPAGAQVVEFGPCNASIHKANEHIRLADVELLSAVYEAVLERMA